MSMTIRPFSAFRLLGASLLAAISLYAAAGPTPPAVRAEIESLLGRLAASGCQFERNGIWHDAPDMRKHLLRKLAAIERGRLTLASTEQFIDVAASESTLSGNSYRVRCGDGEALPSRIWLKQELRAVRAAARHAVP